MSCEQLPGKAGAGSTPGMSTRGRAPCRLCLTTGACYKPLASARPAIVADHDSQVRAGGRTSVHSDVTGQTGPVIPES
jgi:hypothetical protein